MSGSRRAASAARCPIAATHRSPPSWGRNGLAARELARALIEDATGSPALAERHCRELTHAVIAELPALGFELTRDDVLAWLEEPRAA
jgi:hypothetical protein